MQLFFNYEIKILLLLLIINYTYFKHFICFSDDFGTKGKAFIILRIFGIPSLKII